MKFRDKVFQNSNDICRFGDSTGQENTFGSQFDSRNHILAVLDPGAA